MLHAAKKAYLTMRRRWAPAQTLRSQPVQMWAMEGHTDFVMAAAFFKDSRRVITGSWDHTLRVWDVQTGKLVGEPFEGHKEGVRSVAISPDDRRIASGGKDNTIIVWDADSKKMVFDPLVKHTAEVWSVCFSPDGKRLASGSGDCTVVVWDAKTGAVLATLHGHRHTVHSVTFSPDGLELASASSDHTIRVWRTSNATLRLAIDTYDSVRSVVWSPDSQQLISASVYDERIKFWNSSNGVPIGRPSTGHTDYINSLAISFHDSFIATASDDTTVRLWDIKAHQQIGQALQHTTRVRCVVISPNGELLVSGDGKRVLLWSIKDTEQGEAEGRIKDDEETQHQQLLTIHDTHVRLSFYSS
jgi:WD40 repeat protein